MDLISVLFFEPKTKSNTRRLAPGDLVYAIQYVLPMQMPDAETAATLEAASEAVTTSMTVVMVPNMIL